MLEAVMQEPPGGYNHGSRNGESLSTEDAQAEEFMQDGGFGIVEVSTGSTSIRGDNGGVTAHRTVLQAGEHIDLELLRPLIEAGLAYTLAQVAEAYKAGRPSAERLALRRRIDARLLHLSNRGGNMTALARIFGWSIRADGECRTMAAALKRAREAS